MTTVGLYVYRISIHDAATHAEVPMNKGGNGGNFRSFLPKFLNSRSNPVANNNSGRSWHLKPHAQSPSHSEGLIKYGTFGHTSEIVDPANQAPLFSRAQHHVEEIPLYFQFFYDAPRSYALCAFQSFKTWSCVSAVNGDLGAEFKSFTHDTQYLKFSKIMPSAIALYGKESVKKLTLIKKRAKRDKFDSLKGVNADEIDVSLDFSIRRNGTFGRLKDVAQQLQLNSPNNVIMESGLDFEAVTATIKVGKTYRKVGVLGPAINAGVIDVSDDVNMHNGHPTFPSISKVASSTIADFAKLLGL